MKKKLSIAIIILGVIVFSIPIIGQRVTSYLENTMISAWQDGRDLSKDKLYNTVDAIYNGFVDLFNVENAADNSFAKDLSQNEQSVGNVVPEETEINKQNSGDTLAPATPKVNTETTANPTNNTPKKKTVKRKKQQVIGIIKIPKIRVSLPIVEGVEKQNLRVGIGHFSGTANLGEIGNCALAGHRSYALGMMFNRLNEIAIGDKLTLITKKKSFQYKVFRKFVVLPKDVYVLGPVKDDTIVTLVTCTPIRVATHRLIVQARLIN